MALVVSITTFSAFMYYLFLLVDEIVSHIGSQRGTLYSIIVGLLTAVVSTTWLIKKKYHLIPFSTATLTTQNNSHQHSFAEKKNYLKLLQKNLPLWLLTGHSVIYVIFSLLLILPSYVEQLYLILAVIYNLQIFLRGQHLFLFQFKSYFKISNS